MRNSKILGPIVALSILLGAQASPATGQSLEPLSGDEFDRAFLQQMIMHHHMAVVMAQPLLEVSTHDEMRTLGQDIISAQTAEISQMQGWLANWYGTEMGAGMMPMGGMQSGMTMPMGETQPGTTMPMGEIQSGMTMPMGETQPGTTMPMGEIQSGMTMPMGQDMPMGGTQPGMTMPMQPGEGMSGMSMGPGMDLMSLMGLSGRRLEAVFLSLMVPHHEGAISMAELARERTAHDEIRQLAGAIIATQTAEIRQMERWLADWYGL